MIRAGLVREIKQLYIAGYILREIKAELGIDGFTVREAVKKSWNTPERQRLYNRRKQSRKQGVSNHGSEQD